jgi:hypothetical protein
MRKLPSTIQIFGQTITVEQIGNLYNIGDSHGQWSEKTNTIRIQTPNQDHQKDVVFATFFHEVVHAALDLTGHTELSSDEAFVERLAQAMYQAEQSRQYG